MSIDIDAYNAGVVAQHTCYYNKVNPYPDFLWKKRADWELGWLHALMAESSLEKINATS